MYKTRLKAWGITKYNPEAIMAALVRNIENRKRLGKRTRLFKNDAPFSRAKIDSHLKKKGMTEEQLLRKVPSDASLPAGFTCVTPPPELQEDTHSSTSPFTPSMQAGFAMTRPTSSGESGFSSCGHIPTPQPIPDKSQEDTHAPAFFPNFEAERTSGVHPWTMADPINDFGPELCHAIGQGREHIDTDRSSQSSTVDISGEALFLTSPASFLPTNLWDGNLHMSMSANMQNTDCYQPLHCEQPGEAWQSSTVPSDLQPEAFLSFCYLACILHCQGQDQGASAVASKAFKIYETLIKQEHEQALACLNLVLAVLCVYGQNLFAVDLLKNAHQTALRHLHKESSIIVTINFMVQQASRTVMQCGITHARLRVVYDDFKESRSLRHPYTLLAGYNLAWRLALDGDGGLEEANNLLSELQGAAEQTFSKAHMQTIAILTTKARVLSELHHRNKAEELMSEAIRRIEVAYPAKHPYALEAKRRHSIFLYAVNRTSAAEKRLTEVALGRVEVLGLEHNFSKESVKDVEGFLCARGREGEHREFTAKLAEAVSQSRNRKSTRPFQFW